MFTPQWACPRKQQNRGHADEKFRLENKEGTMKKLVVAACMLALILVVGQSIYAQERGMAGVGVRFSYLNFEDDSAGGANIDFDDAFAVGINGTYYFCPWFSVEAGLDYIETEMDLQNPAGSGNLGDLEQMPLLLTGRFHWPLNGWTSPYLALGIGYYFNDISTNSAFLASQGIISVDVDDSFGYHIGAGIEWFLNPNLAFNIDFKYIWNEIDFDTVDAVGPETVEVDADGFVAGISLKYFF